MPKLRKVLVSSGELSGDRIAAPYVTYLVSRGVRCFGLGGDELVRAGLKPVCTRDGVSVTGISEAIGGVIPTLKLLRRLSECVAEADALLLCDFPEVNLRLVKLAKKCGVPVVYLAPPQAWAWRPWRSKRLQDVHYVGCLFPFSCEWYQRQGVNAQWVGHPLADAATPIPHEGNHIAIMPGSRIATVRRILPHMLELAASMRGRDDQLVFTLVRAQGVPEPMVLSLLRDSSVPVGLTTDVESILKRAKIALTHPGTATLHATLRGCLPVSMCNPAPLSHWVGSRLVGVPHLSLPNLILGERVFPEYIVKDSNHEDRVRGALALYQQASRYKNDLSRIWRLCRNPQMQSSPEKAFEPLFT